MCVCVCIFMCVGQGENVYTHASFLSGFSIVRFKREKKIAEAGGQRNALLPELELKFVFHLK